MEGNRDGGSVVSQEGEVNTALPRASAMALESETRATVDVGELPTSYEERSESEAFTIIDILPLAEVGTQLREEPSSVEADLPEDSRVNENCQEVFNNLIRLDLMAREAAVQSYSGDDQLDNDNDDESACRICQMGAAGEVVIYLGCACRSDLCTAHKLCAETWFRVKGNRYISLPCRKLVGVGWSLNTSDLFAKPSRSLVSHNEGLAFLF
jgi:hypothetical protein